MARRTPSPGPTPVAPVAIDPAVLERALVTDRWTVLTRAGFDVAAIGTWDQALPQQSRILVPIDVQAFVAARNAEPTVPITGGPGDPEPFAKAVKRKPGVHLHWAMPDALLVGADDASGDVAFPALPDRWVVIRTLFPIGVAEAIVTGWMIDARTSAIAPLATFTGEFPTTTAPLFEPLDAAIGGSLTWTASYEASSQRFALHDSLDDLTDLRSRAPKGFYGAHAVYTVAGWWHDTSGDPLTGLRGTVALDNALAERGWVVNHDSSPSSGTSPDIDQAGATRLLSSKPATPTTVVSAVGKRDVLGALAVGAVSPVADYGSLVIGYGEPTYATMLHGAVLGVPIDGTVPIDARPKTEACSVAIGIDTDDVVSAFAAPSLNVEGASLLALERLTAAFTGNALNRLSSPDGLEELAEREHDDGFWSVGGQPLPLASPDRLRSDDSVPLGPTAVGRKGRGSLAANAVLGTTLEWTKSAGLRTGKRPPATKRTVEAATPLVGAGGRSVTKPPPRLFRPRPPMIAVRGAAPDHRHHGDGLFDASGLLRCRYPAECQDDIEGVVSGTTVVPTLGSGAVPAEVLTVVREAVLLDPYATGWLAAAGAGVQGDGVLVAYMNRLAAEMTLRYGTDATYDGSSHLPRRAATGVAAVSKWDTVGGAASRVDAQVASVLAEFSVVSGTAPSPVAISTWHQPWIPMWLEWKVTVAGSDTLDGWRLDGLDLEPDTPTPASIVRTFVGRSPIGQGASTALHDGIGTWLTAEAARDASGRGVLAAADQATLEKLGTLLGPIDLVSASFDGLREQLLGIAYIGVLERDSNDLPTATSLPVPLFGGTLSLDALRLVDAFGRTLDLPTKTAVTTSTLTVDDAAMRLRPRLQHGARWLFRLVDPAHPADADPTLAREAFVDQLAPQLAVNPVAGFLLPDHIDEALEVFSVAGDPLGQLLHDEVSGAVTWEPAPGRAVAPDAGPFEGIGPHEGAVAALATGLVITDVAGRFKEPSAPTSGVFRETSLTAFLRAIDTTLWTVDTYATLGTSTVSALTGRPIAVVRATLRLEVPDDVAEVAVTATGGADARRAAFRAIDEQRFPVRLGELHRSDDSLLGFFVDDDYRRFHVVDKVVASDAIVAGRHQGHLGQLGTVITPGTTPIVHPYLVDDDVLFVRPGQAVRLTLLMLPAGKVHLTSGVLPRKALALADDWVTPGLRRLAPSVRVGPVLVDPTEIRLPLVHTLGDAQTFTRRSGPLTWRDDPIVASSQTAYLPTLPHEAQEGWIRVTPDQPEATP
jgi:hypothetical protein